MVDPPEEDGGNRRPLCQNCRSGDDRYRYWISKERATGSMMTGAASSGGQNLQAVTKLHSKRRRFFRIFVRTDTTMHFDYIKTLEYLYE